MFKLYLNLTYFLIFELLLLALGILVIVFYHKVVWEKKRKRDKAVKDLTTHIISNIYSNVDRFNLKLSKETTEPHLLLQVVESINKKILDSYWIKIRNTIVEKYLIKTARKWTKSPFWYRRSFAARTFSIFCNKQDEDSIIYLLRDSIQLIRIQAVKAAITFKTKKTINELINQMSVEKRFSKYIYRDPLFNGDENIYHIIKQRLLNEKDEKIIMVCLDLLTIQIDSNVFDIAKKYIHSPNLELKLTAIRAIANYPTAESAKILYSLYDENNWQARAIVAKSLAVWHSTDSIPVLEKLLFDDKWWVKLNAALTLSKIGVEGKQILKEQDKNSKAYVVANYVLSLG
jgi:hypothetical protein